MTADIRDATAALVAAPIPNIGRGHTDRRWLTLFDWARLNPVSIARLAEAHVDAEAILISAGRQPLHGSLYGVWASGSPSGAALVVSADGLLSGTKTFCSGIGVVDRALITAEDADGRTRLVDVALTNDATWTADTTAWKTAALADTATGSATFEGHPVDDLVGPPDWYLDRPGFWHGAIGPAACWAGAAAGIVDHAERSTVTGPEGAVALGALRAERHLMRSLLRTAGHDIDHYPDDINLARCNAYAVRHLVERSTHRVVDIFSRSSGPRPFVIDTALTQRTADVHLYARQHHGDRDLRMLGQLEPLPGDHG